MTNNISPFQILREIINHIKKILKYDDTDSFTIHDKGIKLYRDMSIIDKVKYIPQQRKLEKCFYIMNTLLEEQASERAEKVAAHAGILAKYKSDELVFYLYDWEVTESEAEEMASEIAENYHGIYGVNVVPQKTREGRKGYGIYIRIK